MSTQQSTELPNPSGTASLPPTSKSSGSNMITYVAAAIVCFLIAGFVFIVTKKDERTGPPQSEQEQGMAGGGMPQGHPDTAMAAVIGQLIVVQDSLRTAEQQHPDDPDIQLKLANTLYDLAEISHNPEHFPESLEYYRKYLAVRPNDEGARTDMAYVMFRSGQVKEAIDELTKVQAANPKHQESAFNLAVLYNESQQPDKAIAQLQKVLAINPKHQQAAFVLAGLYKDQNKPDEAIVQFRRVLAINPKHQQAAFNLVLLYKDQNKPDSVLAYLQLTADIDPTSEVGRAAADALSAYKQSH